MPPKQHHNSEMRPISSFMRSGSWFLGRRFSGHNKNKNLRQRWRCTDTRGKSPHLSLQYSLFFPFPLHHERPRLPRRSKKTPPPQHRGGANDGRLMFAQGEAESGLLPPHSSDYNRIPLSPGWGGGRSPARPLVSLTTSSTNKLLGVKSFWLNSFCTQTENPTLC